MNIYYLFIVINREVDEEQHNYYNYKWDWEYEVEIFEVS